MKIYILYILSILMISVGGVLAQGGNWFQDNGEITLSIGQYSSINLGSMKIVDLAHFEVGCHDGETMDGDIEYLNGSNWINLYSITGAGCGFDVSLPKISTNSLRIKMTGGGGVDSKISWHDQGANGWKIYAEDTIPIHTPEVPIPPKSGGGNWYTGSRVIFLLVGQTSVIDFDVRKKISNIYIKVGCNDGETMDGDVEYLDGSNWINIYSFKGTGCGYNFQFSEITTNSIRVRMTNGGGVDGKISWYDRGSEGWQVYIVPVPCINVVPPSCPNGNLIPQGVDINGCEKPPICEVTPTPNVTTPVVTTPNIITPTPNVTTPNIITPTPNVTTPNVITPTPVITTPTPVITTPKPVITTPNVRVGPTVNLRPVKDDISISEDGLIELYMDNPSLNEEVMHTDVTISVPSGISIYGQGFGNAGAAGILHGVFDISPGKARTIQMTIKAEKTGEFLVKFSGLYWPGDDKDEYQPISLTHNFKVHEIVTTIPTPTITASDKFDIIKWFFDLLKNIFQ